jgi:flagellin
MSIYVKTGSALTHLQNILDRNTTSYQKTLDQLSSGNKYTSVGDNPIDVCKSAKLQVRIDSNSKASANVNVGQNMLSMTEGYHDTIVSNIERIRDLSVQAASGTYASDSINAILIEIKGRLDYIDKISSSASFAGVGLLDGSSSSVFLQIGPNTDSTMNVGESLIDTHTTALGIDLGAATADTWTGADAQAYLTRLDTATGTLTGANAKIGGYMNRLDSVSESLSKLNDNLTETKSTITDTNVATATADMVKYQILQNASVNILVQANQISSMALQLLKYVK